MKLPLSFYVICALAAFSPQARAANVPVTMTNFRFTPANVTVNAGDTVTWNNQQGFHDTVSGANGVPNGLWNSTAQFGRLMFAGESFSFTFTSGGTFPYFCSPHVSIGMVGSVQVNAANTPPSIFIVTPPNGATFSPPADVVFEANASDADGSVARVDFFVNGAPVGSAPAPPYAVTLNDLGEGSYTLTATAFDNAGASASASVMVLVATTPPPECEYALSKSNSSFDASGGADAVSVNTAPECVWVAANTNSWIVIQSGASGSGPGTINFLVLSNAMQTARTGVLVIAGQTFTVTQEAARFAAKNDFDHDGQTDFLWQDVNGRLRLWLMSSGLEGLTRTATLLLRNGRPMGRGWNVVGTHDFNLDNNVDILWQHRTGPLALWVMNSTNFVRSERMAGVPRAGRVWRVTGVGDLNQDGQADLLLRHRHGYLLAWFMSGTRFVSQSLLLNGEPVPRVWQVAGVAEANGDGQADVIWQGPNRAIVIWFMAGGVPASGPRVPHAAPPKTRIVGLNDLNRDNRVDLIWQHTNRSLSTWLMDGTNRVGSLAIHNGEVLSSRWKLVAPKN